jgi:hypothetical protein
MSDDIIEHAWNHIKTSISDGFGESDASIYTWALQRIRLNSDIDSAQELLEQKAFNGSDNALTTALLDEPAVDLCDSRRFDAAWHLWRHTVRQITQRLHTGLILWLTICYRADLLWLINKDTTSATDLITGLWADHPEDIRVRTMYVSITQDTTAYWHGFEDAWKNLPCQ